MRSWVEDHYGIGVLSFDVAAPFSGDLDGREIRIDPEFGVELMVFNLIHLFGHTVTPRRLSFRSDGVVI